MCVGLVEMHLALRVAFPLRGGAPESQRGGNPRKMGKNYKIPFPSPTPENGEKLPPKRGKLTPKRKILYFFCNFALISGVGPGRGILYFFPIFRDFRPGGVPGPLRGKTTCRDAPCTQSGSHRLLELLFSLPFLDSRGYGIQSFQEDGEEQGCESLAQILQDLHILIRRVRRGYS